MWFFHGWSFSVDLVSRFLVVNFSASVQTSEKTNTRVGLNVLPIIALANLTQNSILFAFNRPSASNLKKNASKVHSHRMWCHARGKSHDSKRGRWDLDFSSRTVFSSGKALHPVWKKRNVSVKLGILTDKQTNNHTNHNSHWWSNHFFSDEYLHLWC